jgi:acyl CoA:acetate/3-ketoacid CoA transferase alpha subunit
MNKTVSSLAQALADIPDGATVMIGFFGGGRSNRADSCAFRVIDAVLPR